MTSLPLFQNTLILRMFRVVIFADIIKIYQIFKDSKKLKELKIMHQNAIYIIFIVIA